MDTAEDWPESPLTEAKYGKPAGAGGQDTVVTTVPNPGASRTYDTVWFENITTQGELGGLHACDLFINKELHLHVTHDVPLTADILCSVWEHYTGETLTGRSRIRVNNRKIPDTGEGPDPLVIFCLS